MMILQTSRAALSSGLDADALAYITAVEAVDGQSLESGVKIAFNSFVKGCKSDGIWDAIKASCIMAGARTLSGALVPLKGTAPTNFNFVSGDYNRRTGLVGDGISKYIDTNRNNNADPQDNFSVGTYATTSATIATSHSIGAGGASGGSTLLGSYTGSARNRSNLFVPSGSGFTGYHGTSRSSSTGFDYRRLGLNQFVSFLSISQYNGDLFVFANNAATTSNFSDARLSFYHIGESLDLAKLDSRVSTLMSNIATAIP